ncbi:VOC family protein [Rhizobium rhizogenes]|uniref:Ring-cleavage extradiol dioxygenase n=1 Tax=Rhizobium rhizogenes (strain K84 / ATCC BAA-868) TaxID=311403 RepID=B9JP01_RHIR8|nr:ring-cleavage extradiol dioxygenase [Rhizobium rhizogenes K84]
MDQTTAIMSDDNTIEILQFDHIQMDVADLEENIIFYKSIFGFEIKEMGVRAMTRWAILGNRHKLYLCMHENLAGKGKKNEGLVITHFGLIVTDFDNVLSKLKARNVSLAYDFEVQYHSSKSVYFFDPNGYKIEISERIGGGIDR